MLIQNAIGILFARMFGLHSLFGLIGGSVSFFQKKLNWPNDTPFLKMISELSLGVFLSMTLMDLQLWRIIPILGPMSLLLVFQLLFSIFYTLMVVFPLMGKDYDSAVVCSGFGGISLGATLTAMANMSAITRRYGTAYKAFVIVPLVSAFLIDITNALVINLFLILDL